MLVASGFIPSCRYDSGLPTPIKPKLLRKELTHENDNQVAYKVPGGDNDCSDHTVMLSKVHQALKVEYSMVYSQICYKKVTST